MESIDIIHAHFSFPAGHLAMNAARKYKKPYIVTEHASNFEFLYNFGLDVKQVLKKATHVICVSELLKKSIKKFIELDTNKISIVPMGLDAKKFYLKEEIIKPKDFLQLIFIGGLYAHKGCHILLKSLHLLKTTFSNFKLKIIGDGPEMQNLKTYASSLKLEKHIQFCGSLSHEKLLKHLSESDIFISSSLKESFGMVIIEALSCGVPVIATKSGGPENFLNKNVGILIDINDEKKMCEAILHMKSNLDKYHPKVLNKFVYDNFSCEILSKKINDIYIKTKNVK